MPLGWSGNAVAEPPGKRFRPSIRMGTISRSAIASPSPADPARAVTRGQDCRQALAELGKPDRQREVPPLDSASDPVTEYIYEPAGSASPTRTRVVCANGRVEGVDRTVVR